MSTEPKQQRRLTQEAMDRIDVREEYVTYRLEELKSQPADSEYIDLLSDDEIEDLNHYRECRMWGTYEPYAITGPDVVFAAVEHGVVSKDREGDSWISKEEEEKLEEVLWNKWDTLDEANKVMYHFLNNTLPAWGHMYEPTPEFENEAREFVNKKPERKRRS